MEKSFTPEQHEVLDLLTKMSNIISNSVWMAENTESDINGKIETAIWTAEHFISEIKQKQSSFKCRDGGMVDADAQ